MAERPSDLQRLASLLLEQDVCDYIALRRNNGISWRVIARDLARDTEGEVDVTYETLRAWHTSREVAS